MGLKDINYKAIRSYLKRIKIKRNNKIKEKRNGSESTSVEKETKNKSLTAAKLSKDTKKNIEDQTALISSSHENKKHDDSKEKKTIRVRFKNLFIRIKAVKLFKVFSKRSKVRKELQNKDGKIVEEETSVKSKSVLTISEKLTETKETEKNKSKESLEENKNLKYQEKNQTEGERKADDHSQRKTFWHLLLDRMSKLLSFKNKDKKENTLRNLDSDHTIIGLLSAYENKSFLDKNDAITLKVSPHQLLKSTFGNAPLSAGFSTRNNFKKKSKTVSFVLKLPRTFASTNCKI